MNQEYSYTTQYTLDKSHFSECFDESAVVDNSIKAYRKAIIFAVVGTALMLTNINGYASWFLIALSALEALSVKFRKPWWLMRQMISKAANNEVTLTINESGISNDSFYVQGTILWDDIIEFTETKQGFLLKQAKGVSYLSKRSLDETAIQFVKDKAASKALN
ncbi:YcxB family protein [Shewanella fidelis]|uniref:YcxB family protein n=1 Tax=Shewanella fidelis TaxID=173509 RepID=A0AAW8NP56_9GAMM|nr:YcxB family protein [Shewanella fidelis]MDR8524942.1 YcxB family protein [Shewanella fidelis]MDW4811013.1 YcxB family protein [Shewanella fidelis]MDW4815208.1 YcxB family protein [Shewanella fidelis]MDW4819298.1 YcxB family protein [Shewanella fidelis]MDW4823024.1 YcxB family protein [Shewanella fidelis]